MDNKKRYKVRIYVFDKTVGNIINLLIRIKAIRLENSMDGVNDCLAIYDGVVTGPVLLEVMKLTNIFPLDNYADFVITCPNCGERIDDNMILNVYDENLLSGYNINCHRYDCGIQTAQVEFNPDL